MYRLKISVLLLAMLLLLTSCSFAGTNMEGESMPGRYIEPTKEIAAARFTKVLEAIDNRDSEALKSLFSEKALAEAEKLDASIEYLFDLVQGDVVSWEEERQIVDESVRNAKTNRQLCTWYILTTTEDTYLFFLLDFDKDEIELDNQGLYALRGIKEENAATQYGPWQEMDIPGVYKPE